MRIAFTAQWPSLHSDIEKQFSKTKYFLIFDTDTMKTEVYTNPAFNQDGKAVQGAYYLSRKKLDIMVTGYCGPKSLAVLANADVSVILKAKGFVHNYLFKLIHNVNIKQDLKVQISNKLKNELMEDEQVNASMLN